MNPASIPQRILAALVDGLLFFPIASSPFYLNPDGIRLSSYVIFGSISIVLGAFYYIGCHGWKGQTIGKRLVGIRVVSDDFQPISYRTATIRYSLFLILAVVLQVPIVLSLTSTSLITRNTFSTAPAWPSNINILWIIGQLCTIWGNPQRKGIHDFLARTQVIQCSPPAVA